MKLRREGGDSGFYLHKQIRNKNCQGNLSPERIEDGNYPVPEKLAVALGTARTL